MKKRILIWSTIILNLFLIKMISAFNWGYYSSPSYYLDNEWVRFIIFFIIFFAVIYFAVNKSLKENKGAAAVIAGGISLLITLAIEQRGLLYSYAGDQIGSWLLIIAVLIGIAFLIKFAYSNFGGIGTAIALIIIWLLIHYIDPYEYLPSEILFDQFIEIYQFIGSWIGLVITIILSLIMMKFKKNETIGEGLSKLLSKRSR